MKGASPRGGRPKKALAIGSRTQIGLRVGAEVKRHLDNAINESGRTLSQEAELRIELSFHAQRLLDNALEVTYGRQLAGLMLMLGDALSQAGRLGALIATRSPDGMDQWLSNAPAFDQACKAAVLVLESLRPTGDVEFPKETGPSLRVIDPDTLGDVAAVSVLSAAKDPEGINRGLPTLEQNLDREQRGRRAHALLGPTSANIRVPDLRDLKIRRTEGEKQ